MESSVVVSVLPAKDNHLSLHLEQEEGAKLTAAKRAK